MSYQEYLDRISSERASEGGRTGPRRLSFERGYFFCSNCGSNVKGRDAHEETSSDTCPNCGTNYSSGVKHCWNCGASIPRGEKRRTAGSLQEIRIRTWTDSKPNTCAESEEQFHRIARDDFRAFFTRPGLQTMPR